MPRTFSKHPSIYSIVAILLWAQTASVAAITDPNNPTDPVIDTESPIITNTATDLSIPIPATPTTPNLTPIVTPSLDSSIDGIVKAGIKVTDKVVATDTETTFTFKPSGKIGPLGPGEHTITWTATDQGLNSVTAEQTITVQPSVNLSLSQTVSEGGIATVTAILSGPAPSTSYPFTLNTTISGTADGAGDDYSVIDGAFDFSSGATSDSISFTIIDDGAMGEGDETIVITLDSPATPNAFNGHANEHTITIKDKGDVNHVPLARLHASQNNQTTRIITTDAGKVTICAMPDCGEAYDAGGGVIRYDWSASDNALVPTTGTTGNFFEFEPSGLNPGFYTIRLTVSDSADNASVHDLQLYLRETGIVLTEADSDDDKIKDDVESYYDNDNDGIPNFLDAIENNPSLMQAYEPYLFDPNLKIEDSLTVDSITLSWQLSSSVSNLTVYPLLIATSPGLHINIGPTAFAATKTYARLETSLAEALRGANVAEGLISSDGQVIDIEISNLNSVGDSALIVLPQAAPIPASKPGTTPQFITFKNTMTWEAFTVDANNRINTDTKRADNYCPDFNNIATTSPYPPTTPELASGDECLLVTIQDGGPNDYDGVANGTIRLMGSVFITSDSVADTNQTGGGIFTGDTDSALEGQNKLNIGTGSGGGSLGFIALFGLLLTTLIRRFSHANQ